MMLGLIFQILAFFAEIWTELKIRETIPEPEHKQEDDEEGKGKKK